MKWFTLVLYQCIKVTTLCELFLCLDSQLVDLACQEAAQAAPPSVIAKAFLDVNGVNGVWTKGRMTLATLLAFK